jgi:hypothetical protein
MNVNTTSAFVAAQQAAGVFEQLPDTASRTFIYTGNILNSTTIAALLSSGAGKSATAHIVQAAASAYKDRGLKYLLRNFLYDCAVLTTEQILLRRRTQGRWLTSIL